MKYKLCCLGRQETAEREAYPARIRDQIRARQPQHYRIITDDPLTNLSNHATNLIQQGHLDEAEKVCRALVEQFPDEVDGLHRTAMLLEARGDKSAAADCMRNVLAMATTQDGFEEESFQWMREEIARLES